MDLIAVFNKLATPVFGPSGPTHASGLVPDPGSSSGTVRFLREDGSWSSPPANNLINANDQASSGQDTSLQILTTMNQTGTAASADLYIKKTWNNSAFPNGLGSGAQNMIQCDTIAALGQLSPTTVFTVDNTGLVTAHAGFSGNLTGNVTGNVSGNATSITGSITESQVTNLVTNLAAKVPTSTTISTTAPMTGGGALSSNLTLGVSVFVASGGSHASGLVPDPGGSAGSTRFLREDATWVNPPLNQLAVPVSNVSFNSVRLTTLQDPVLAQDAATKNYVDNKVLGLTWMAPVQVLATANQASLSGLPTVDGVTLTDSQRILLTGQSTASQNGIWLVHAGAWTRSTDYASGAVVTDDSAAFVIQGTTYKNTGWVLSNTGTVTVDTTSTTWVQFTGGSGVTFGNPTASVGLAAVNGSAGTAMRSDAAPALSQSIVPTWTGAHTFSTTTTMTDTTQADARIILAGQEFYQAAHTDTAGVAILCGVNRTANRQLWIGDSANLTQNGTNTIIRILPNSPAIDAMGTDGTTTKNLTIGNGGGVTIGGAITLTDLNIILGTTTGTKIGTATNQKLGFFNATPVVQQSGDILTALSNLGLVTSPTLSSSDTVGTLITVVNPSFATPYTPAPTTYNTIINFNGANKVTSALTINAPTGSPADGWWIKFRILQDSSGGHVITWNSAFVFTTNFASTDLSTAANARYEVLAEYDSDKAKWVMVSYTGTY